MIKNYIKIAWKVLKRNKLFTIISLFGISLTLTILIVGFSFLDYFTKSNYPALKQERLLYVNRVHLYEKKTDNGYNNSMQSACGYHLLNNYVKKLKIPERITIFSEFKTSSSTYFNGNKIELKLQYTDANFWEILDFDFVYGKPFGEKEVANAEPVIVISEKVAKTIGDKNEALIGKTLEIDNQRFRIIGVVKDPPITNFSLYANIWAPLTTTKDNLEAVRYDGDYAAILLAKSKNDLKRIDNELQQVLKKLPMPLDNYKHINLHALTLTKSHFANSFIKFHRFVIMLVLLVLVLMLIPSLNLININTSRIRERLSEIGVRKSFGATKKSLITQFVVENVMITVLGGLFAFAFTIIILKFLVPDNIVPLGFLPVNLRIFFTGLFLSFVFGLLSGLLPAMRMSKFKIVESLNENEL